MCMLEAVDGDEHEVRGALEGKLWMRSHHSGKENYQHRERVI